MHELIRRLARLLLPFIGTAVIVAACVGTGAVSPTPLGSSSPPLSPSPSTAPTSTPTSTPSASPSSSPATGAISHPTGSKDLVFRFDNDGGLIAPGSNLGHVPQISVYGDGLVVMPGLQPMIYPPAARPSLVAARLSEPGLQALLAAAEKAGLLGKDADYPANGIADAPTASFTVVADGVTHHVTAYALLESQSTDGLDAATIAARAALLDFTNQLGDPATLVGAANFTDLGAYVPDRMRVIAMPVPNPRPSVMAEPPVAWPLSTPLASFGSPLKGTNPGLRCGVVEGADLALLNPAIDKATSISPWTSGGDDWTIAFRPELPDETGCPGQ